MPALIFMGRRWGVGSDEFSVPSFCSMALRVVWSLTLAIVLFAIDVDLTSCRHRWLVDAYIGCSLLTFGISVVVEWCITRVSTRGSIANTTARETLGGYLVAHMFLAAVQVVFGVLGIALATGFDSMCDGEETDEALKILLYVVAVSQVVDVLVLSCCFFLMRGDAEDAVPGPEGYHDFERLQSTEIEGHWKSRCHCLYGALKIVTCGLFSGHGLRQADFEHLARILARIFHTEEYLDVVPSDIAAGIVLLYHKQRHKRHAERVGAVLPASSGFRGEGRSIRGASENGASGERQAAQGGGEQDSLNPGVFPEWRDSNQGGDAIPRSLQHRFLEHENFYKVRGRELVDVDKPPHLKALQEISHFSRYALAIYTWYLYVFARPCSGCCELLCYSCTGRSRAFHRARGNKRWSSDSDVDENNDDSGADADSEARESNGPGRGAPAARSAEAETISGPSPSIGVEMASGSEGAPVSAAAAGNCQRGGGVSIRGDNWLGIHEAGLLRVAGFHSDCEVVDAHFSSGITATPYCVLVDHNWRCVVVSIRGTMSLEEIVSDLYAEPASMEECGRRWGFDGRDMFAHQGVLERAKWMRQDLETQGHLRALLGPQTATNRRPRLRSYSLYVTGHSLGGSTGVLLSYMLQKDYPSVRCVAITPMGGLLDKAHAESCGDFVLSAVMGDDVVPRLSVTSMERMRDEVLELIARSKANKLKVMRSIVRNVFRPWGGRRSGSSSSRDVEADDLGGLLYPEADEVPETRYSKQLRRYKEWVKRKEHFRLLLPPGRIVHFVKTHKNRNGCLCYLCSGDPWLFTPVWAKPTDFGEIVVTRRMFEDHLPTISFPRFEKTWVLLKEEADRASKGGSTRLLPH